MKTIFFILVLVFTNYKAFSQDLHFSQYDRVPLIVNPAQAGTEYKTRVNMNYRTQWRSVNSPFKNFGFSVDQKLTKNHNSSGFIGVGLNINKENAGNSSLNILNANASVSGHVKLNNVNTIGVGLQCGLMQRSFSNSDLQWGSQFSGNTYNPAIAQTEFANLQSVSIFDMATGIVYHYDESQSHHVTDNHDRQLLAGFSLSHLNKSSISFIDITEKLPIRFALHASSMFSLSNSSIAIGPGFLFQKQGKATEFLFGSKFRYSLVQASKMTGINQTQTITLSTFYRVNDAVIIAFEYRFADFSLNISYDVNASRLSPYSHGRGAFELSLKLGIQDYKGRIGKF